MVHALCERLQTRGHGSTPPRREQRAYIGGLGGDDGLMCRKLLCARMYVCGVGSDDGTGVEIIDTHGATAKGNVRQTPATVLDQASSKDGGAGGQLIDEPAKSVGVAGQWCVYGRGQEGVAGGKHPAPHDAADWRPRWKGVAGEPRRLAAACWSGGRRGRGRASVGAREQ